MGEYLAQGTVREVNAGIAGCRRRGGGLAVLAGLAIGLGLGVGAAADEPSPLEQYPGRRVMVGDHALHIDCGGQAVPGRPVIVLESGIGGFSLEWHAVKAALAREHRVCAYDRAGYGWSDAARGPRSAARSAHELAILLAAAGEVAPYVLAGHSYGGYVVREFAARFPERVAGLVLIDAAAPEQFERLPAGALPRIWAAALVAGTRVHSVPRPAAGFPPAAATLGMQLMMLPKARAAYAAEVVGFAASARHLAALENEVLAVPLVVLSRGRTEFDAHAGGSAAELAWREMQAAMVTLSSRAAHWIATGAGHQVHAERPELVVHALDQVATGAASFTTPASTAVAVAWPVPLTWVSWVQ
ncbi:MAG: alpha/beta fold hydrolase [Gammaproteobacteria bacterium]